MKNTRMDSVDKTVAIICSICMVCVTVIIVVALLSSCAGSPETSYNEPDAGEWDNEAVAADEGATIESIRVVGPYLGVEQENIDCLFNDDHIDLNIELVNGRPTIPVRPNMLCDWLKVEDHTWNIHCREHTITSFIWYWEDFLITVDEYNPHTGNFYWWVDGLDYFWCIRTFEVEAQVVYSY